MAQFLLRSHGLFFFLFYLQSVPENIRYVKLALQLLSDLAQVVFVFVHQLVHVLVSLFVCLVQLIVQQLAVVHSEAALLATTAHDFVDCIQIFLRQLGPFKLRKNDFNGLLVF